jgi:hypothetical protein
MLSLSISFGLIFSTDLHLIDGVPAPRSGDGLLYELRPYVLRGFALTFISGAPGSGLRLRSSWGEPTVGRKSHAESRCLGRRNGCIKISSGGSLTVSWATPVSIWPLRAARRRRDDLIGENRKIN